MLSQLRVDKPSRLLVIQFAGLLVRDPMKHLRSKILQSRMSQHDMPCKINGCDAFLHSFTGQKVC